MHLALKSTPAAFALAANGASDLLADTHKVPELALSGVPYLALKSTPTACAVVAGGAYHLRADTHTALGPHI